MSAPSKGSSGGHPVDSRYSPGWLHLLVQVRISRVLGGPKSGLFWVPNREIHHIDPRDLQILGPISPRSGPRSQDPRGSEDPTDQIQGSPLTLQTGFSHKSPVWGGHPDPLQTGFSHETPVWGSPDTSCRGVCRGTGTLSNGVFA